MDPTPAPTPSALLAVWRQRAQFLSDFGDSNSARLWIVAAGELEGAIKTFGDDTLSLVEAARVSGFTPPTSTDSPARLLLVWRAWFVQYALAIL
jgi:hypothetical protein